MRDKREHSLDELTSDSLLDGKLLIYQPARGYRFSMESPLLAWFAGLGKPARKCADLGAGCGVIGLYLLHEDRVREVVAVEIQSRLAYLAEKNAKTNNLELQFKVINDSVENENKLLEEKSFELVVSNPPFWPANSGRLPPDEERRIARHEMKVTLKQIIHRAKKLLHPRKGRLCIAYPANRLENLILTLKQSSLRPEKALFVHPSQKADAEIVLLESRYGKSGSLTVMPPLYLEEKGFA